MFWIIIVLGGVAALAYITKPFWEKKDSKVTKTLETAGNTVSFVGRLVWTLLNFGLAVLCVASMFLLDGLEWYLYLAASAVAIGSIINGIRCIIGESYLGP